MTRVPFEIPPGLNTDDTASAAAPAWVDGSNVRFRLGKAETIGGWEGIIADALGGVCRAAFAWTDNSSSNILNIAFGTHQTLELFQGGALFDITPTADFTAGQINGTGSTGYGTGAYGVGNYGEPSTTDYFPLTWSLGAYGQTLIANPRNQPIFQWSNDTGVEAARLTNCPDNVTYALVAPTRQIFALGCNEEVSGTFNPLCIRHCGVAAPTNWTTTSSSASTAREYILPGGGRIVGGRFAGKTLLVWTNHGLYAGTYFGQIAKVWQFDRVGDKCGLIGPGAAVVLGSTAFWISPDRQFHSYTVGGAVQTIPCPIRTELESLSASQADKIVASSTAEYSEICFDYPDSRDGTENSRYLALCVEGPDAGSWYKGEMARTARTDAGPASYPVGVDPDGMIYWQERGHSADGGAFSWFIESADIIPDDNMAVLIRGMWPDIADQVGPVTFTPITRDFPQGDATTWPSISLAPSDDKADFKASGRLVRMRFEGSSAPSRARIGRPTFDVKSRGRK